MKLKIATKMIIKICLKTNKYWF